MMVSLTLQRYLYLFSLYIAFQDQLVMQYMVGFLTSRQVALLG